MKQMKQNRIGLLRKAGAVNKASVFLKKFPAVGRYIVIEDGGWRILRPESLMVIMIRRRGGLIALNGFRIVEIPVKDILR